MELSKTIAIARNVLADGRILDASRMIEPLLVSSSDEMAENGSADRGQLMLRSLMARIQLLHHGDSRRVFELLQPYERLDRRAGLAPDLRAEIALWLGWASAWQNDEFYDDAQALNLLDEAEGGFRDALNPAGRCWTLIGRAHAYFTIDEYQLMLQALREAESLQENLNDVLAASWIHHLSVTGARFEGRYRAAEEHADRLDRLAAAHHDELALGRARAHRAALGYELGRPPKEIVEMAEEAEVILVRAAANPGSSLLSAYHAHIGALVRSGDWKRADRLIDDCLDRIGSLDTAPAYITLHRAQLAMYRGGVDDALALLEDIASRVHRHHRLLVSSVNRVYSEALTRKGDLEAAFEHAEKAFLVARDAGHVGYQLKALLQRLQVAVEAGQEGIARELFRQVEMHADYFGLLPLAALRFLIHGRLAVLRGRSDEARAYFAQALSAYSLTGDTYSVALVQHELARANASVLPTESRHLAEAAAHTFERLEAVREQEQVRELLRNWPATAEGTFREHEASIGSIVARAAISVDLVAEAWLQAAEELAPARWLVVYRVGEQGEWSLVHKRGDLPDDLTLPDPSVERVCEQGVDWMRLRGLPAPAFFFGMECGGDDDPACAAIEKRLQPWIPVVGLALEHALLRAARLGTATASGGVASRGDELGVNGLVYASPEMQAVAGQIRRVRSGHSPVLITGERGVGKDLVAHVIHGSGDRREQPFVSVSCSSISPEVLERALFGAASDQPGALQEAHHGTLYLDEIAGLSPAVQPKLLEFLENGWFHLPGAGKKIHADVRIIASTRHDLRALVREERVREDLLYRLNVVPIRIPPLRERREEIPILVQHFLKTLTSGRPGGASVTSGALDALIHYDWPGNVRQLRNEIERLVVFAASEPVSMIDVEDLPEAITSASCTQEPLTQTASEAIDLSLDGRDLDDILAGTEKSVIERVLSKHAGQVSSAADALGLSRQGLYKKMKRLGIDSSEFQSDLDGASQRSVS